VSGVDPLADLEVIVARAGINAPFDHAAVTLATSTRDGRPSARIVLLRGVDARGCVFFTNYESQKAQELEENPQAALCGYWPWLDEQVRIEGRVERVSAAESDQYFAGRERGSQIGAWASAQSRPLGSRAELERRYHEIDERYAGQPVPRPPNWGGYRLVPDRIEFWRAGTYRLHDRQVYVRHDGAWRRETLYP
jgi:pyridoxamine 5'-phosphate oxidase